MKRYNNFILGSYGGFHINLNVVRFLNEKIDWYKSNLEIAQKIAFELGEEIVTDLGTGAWGKAYSTKSGKVLKLTSDISEFNRAYTLSRTKNRTKYLINYYNVGEIIGCNIEAYYILMDQVFPLSNLEYNILDDDFINTVIIDIVDGVKITKNIFIDDALKYLNMYNNYSDNEIKKSLEKLYPHIVNIAKELKLHKIHSFDFHGGNIGWDKDKKYLVYFDIGGYTKKDNYERNNKKITIIDEKI